MSSNKNKHLVDNMAITLAAKEEAKRRGDAMRRIAEALNARSIGVTEKWSAAIDNHVRVQHGCKIR